MQSIAAALGALTEASKNARRALWTGALAQSRDEFGRPRRYKVRLSVMITSEVEVTAANPTDAERKGEQLADEATVTRHTAPFAFGLLVQKRSNAKDPESPLKWVEIEIAPVDPNNPDSPTAWQFKR